MIRLIIILVIAMSTFLLTGANNKKTDTQSAKKFCRGYSVIEADKGIDCHGDTIRLVKVSGFYERAI
jgi:hypothetical protein